MAEFLTPRNAQVGAKGLDMIASMKKTVWLVVLLLITICVGPLLSGPVAQAGDAAEFRSHGFSADKMGRYFAFEEFGTQDGSGFPFSNIYIVDLQTDKWVPQTPIRILLEDESQPQLAARIQAFQQATPLMEKYGISNSGVMMAASPLNEVSDKAQLEFRQSINPLLSNQLGSYRLQLSNIDVRDLNNCGFQNGRVMGFSLSLTKPNGQSTTLHDESTAPQSRGCPSQYHLIAVFAPNRHREATYAVALVGVFSQGFEGPDLRYIAVPFSF